MEILYLFAAVIGLAAVAISISVWKTKRRAEQMRRAAQSAGFSYQADGSSLLSQGIAEVPLFALAALGRQCRIANVMAGVVGETPVTVCDYVYWTGSISTHRFDYAQTVACFPTEAGRLPAFTLHPRGGSFDKATGPLARRMAKALAAVAAPITGQDPSLEAVRAILEREGEKGIDVEGCPEFSERYRLLGADRQSVKVLFRPLAHSFLRKGAAPVCIECAGRWLVIYRKNRLTKPEELRRFVQECARLKSVF